MVQKKVIDADDHYERALHAQVPAYGSQYGRKFPDHKFLEGGTEKNSRDTNRYACKSTLALERTNLYYG